LRDFHRGIYEHLWSEHRFAAIAVSQRRYHAVSSKLGRVPHVLSLLKILARIAGEPQDDRGQALLHAYQAARGDRDRRWARATIESLLAQPEDGAERIFRAALEDGNLAVTTSRLFSPAGAAFKLWEPCDPPGLWVLFGPMQMHLEPEMVRNRLTRVADACGVDFPALLSELSHGLPAAKWEALPEALQKAGAAHLLVARAGTTIWLHPRAMECLLSDMRPTPTRREEDPMMARAPERIAGAVLESRWDAFPDEVGTLAEWDIFREWWISGMHPEPVSCKEDTITAGYAFLVEQFAHRQALEFGSPLTEEHPKGGEGEFEAGVYSESLAGEFDDDLSEDEKQV
jgi:hypothetical protein